MRRAVLLLAIALAAGAAFWWLRPKPQGGELAYVVGRNVTAWTRLSQVREPAAELRYAERVTVLERRSGHARVRNSAGAIGWVSERQLMDAEMWRRSTELVERAHDMPVQALGRTKVLSNLRAEPGRAAPRIYQVPAGFPVQVLGRAVAEWKPSEEEAILRGTPPQEKQAQPRAEDWLLVRARMEDIGELAGWTLGRFIEPDLPGALRDYAVGVRFLAWFELNRVPDEEGEKPQYLAVGTTGPEGQPCDLTLLRFYTWNRERRRYETAYVESFLCGRLPVRVTREGLQSASFSFTAVGKKGEEVRRYRMRQNIVRRLRVPRR